MSDLWHYTCDHGHERIDASGSVIPGAFQTGRFDTPGVYAWFTDLSVPIRDGLGLTSQILTCDRTAHRYRVTDPTGIVPWSSVRRSCEWAEELEAAEGARPRHWFVATGAVPVEYAPVTAAIGAAVVVDDTSRSDREQMAAYHIQTQP